MFVLAGDPGWTGFCCVYGPARGKDDGDAGLWLGWLDFFISVIPIVARDPSLGGEGVALAGQRGPIPVAVA